MNNIFSKKFFVWLSIILFSCGVYLWSQCYVLKSELDIIRTDSEKMSVNNSVLNFTQLFIEKVIMTDKEVDFDTRLRLENAVRSIKDDQILEIWKQFIASKTESEAQSNVKELLGVLIKKIKI